ncbi:choline transport protein [Physcia stellaris]|nr:choline transport protein [Physcia stellaris]
MVVLRTRAWRLSLGTLRLLFCTQHFQVSDCLVLTSSTTHSITARAITDDGAPPHAPLPVPEAKRDAPGSPFKLVDSPNDSALHKRFDFGSLLVPASPSSSSPGSASDSASNSVAHGSHNTPNSKTPVHISTIIYGGRTVSDPTVIARCIDYAHSAETFEVGSEFFGGDPSYGIRKWVFVAYTDGEGGGKMRYLVGWEKDMLALGGERLSSSSSGQALHSDGDKDGEVTLYAIAYGGKLINNVDVVERLAGYAKSGQAFTVGNDLFGTDPAVGSKKYGIIAYTCGKAGKMKYLVAYEDEKRTLGKYWC